MHFPKTTFAVALAATALLSSCTEATPEDIALQTTAASEVSNATTTTTRPPATNEQPTPEASDATALATAEASGDDGLNLFGGDDPEDLLMPDVICMGLQAAQDEIQDHGVFFSRSEDATGQGRWQVLDRNWVVVAQSPSPGTPIGEFDAVLDVVKWDEPHGCNG